MNRVVRAVLVVEAEKPDGTTEAYVVNQTGGAVQTYYTSQWTWNERGEKVPWEGTRSHRIELRGSGEVIHFDNADDLFRRWGGPQPIPIAGELPAGTLEIEQGES